MGEISIDPVAAIPRHRAKVEVKTANKTARNLSIPGGGRGLAWRCGQSFYQSQLLDCDGSRSRVVIDQCGCWRRERHCLFWSWS